MFTLLSAPAIDTSVFTTIADGAETILGLFTIFPLNIFLALGIVGVTVGLVLRLKRS